MTNQGPMLDQPGKGEPARSPRHEPRREPQVVPVEPAPAPAPATPAPVPQRETVPAGGLTL